MIASEKLLELQARGYCVLRSHLPAGAIDACREALWPTLLSYLRSHEQQPNRGPHRHYLPMPFEPPCFAREFFFDAVILEVVRGAMDRRVVADQWGCDVPLRGSEYQAFHVDYRRPLFEEAPDLALPPYMLAVSFGLVPVTPANGPMELAPGTHRMARETMAPSVEAVTLDVGDVLIRHPWTLHRGTPNTTCTPRPLLTIRYVRRWYFDDSREVAAIPASVWQTLTDEEKAMLRFPIGS